MNRRVSATLCIVFLTAAASRGAEPSELPIRKVVLYKHGIGYFERSGDVSGNATVRLRFKQDQMSDVLKTLTVLDRGGGSIAAVAYDSQKPQAEILSEFAFDLRQDQIQQSLLRQLRGARIEAEIAGRGTLKGSVLGLDFVRQTADAQAIAKPRLSIFTDAGEIVGADLFDVRSLTFEDAAIQADLQRFLGTLRQGQRRDDKALELVCTGDGARPIMASYAVEQPVWKASYRLVLLGDGTLLQGWAIVDNTSEDDWTDVDLALIAGLPVSFRHDLYTPRRRPRPDLTASLRENASILVVEEARRGELEDKMRQLGYGGGKKDDKRKWAADEEKSVRKLDSFGEALESQEAESVTREIGDLLEYRIDHKVSIPRNRSALLPIVAAKVDAAKVSLYRESNRTGNPMAALRFVNTSGVTLEAGPVTVLEGDTYAGESLLESLKANEKRYVPYAVDLGVKATTKYETRTDKTSAVAFARGLMITKHRQVEQKTYSFDNKNDEPRTVVIEHGKRPDYQLVSPAKASEDELTVERFELALGPKETKSLAVVEALERSERIAISSIDAGAIELYVKQGVLSDAALAFLKEALAARGAIQQLQAKAQQLEAELAQKDTDQNRIRGNLQSLRDSNEEKDLRATYVKQLESDEKRIREAQGELKALRATIAEQQAALDRKLVDFALEYTLG